MEITRKRVYLKRADCFLTVSAYSSHLVTPFSHNQKLQCWGKNKPLRFTAVFTPPPISVCIPHPQPPFTAPDDRKCLASTLGSIRRGQIGTVPPPHILNLWNVKYTLWETCRQQGAAHEEAGRRRPEMPSAVPDGLAEGTPFVPLVTPGSQTHSKASP